MAAFSNTVFFATILLVLYKTEGLDLGSGIPSCSPWMADCDTSDVLATLTCKDGDEPLPQCESSDSVNYPIADATLNYDTMNEEKCRAQCTNKNGGNGGVCFYYKFLAAADTKYCYLMSFDQCKDFGNNENCGITPEHCMSGPEDPNSCEENDDGIVTPPYTCKGSGDIHKPGPGFIPNYQLHWYCTDVHLAEVNIYTNDDITGGTSCVAKPSCPDVSIEYKCEEDSGVGKWVAKGGDDGAFLGGDKLLDPTCNADPLSIVGYSDQVTSGMEIQCVGEAVVDDGNGNGNVKAQNSCLVLCEDFPVLHFYTDKNVWMYTSMLESGAPETLPDASDSDKNVIYCWK